MYMQRNRRKVKILKEEMKMELQPQRLKKLMNTKLK